MNRAITPKQDKSEKSCLDREVYLVDIFVDRTICNKNQRVQAFAVLVFTIDLSRTAKL
ncbi:hypothetical protein [Microcoleus sp. CAWBG24]|uniref:hypothetical protein n=1 Tax=Microcoleus sp. CAWBG24 TaxID=2841644 RepID=UPI0025EDEFE1|nr:hypothetical protein [Microcoleus sp. CAWBG24]